MEKSSESQLNLTQPRSADLGTRVFIFIIDLIFCNLLIAAVLHTLTRWIFPEFTTWEQTGGFFEVRFKHFVLAMVQLFIYYLIFEGLYGKTVGKFLSGTKVVTKEGDIPDFKTVLLRTLCRFIPFDAVSFLIGEPVGWHDTLSNTKVIKVPSRKVKQDLGKE